MAYNNYSFSRGGGFSRAPYQNNGYRRSGGYQQSNRPVKKHSGCTTGIFKKGPTVGGLQYLRGWKYAKSHGLVTFLAHPYKGTGKHVSRNGNVWFNWVVKVYSKRTLTSSLHTCLANADGSKVIIKELGLVMNAKGGPGGVICGFGKRAR